MWHTIHRCAKANNKYMKDYDKNKEQSCVQKLDASSFSERAILSELPVGFFKQKNKT